ncbi:SDR family NAD(P)-dependent oxidoreductase, partial [Xanthomonas oryzae]|nr:SDR family NAD(P)-dependent oxidoreductase [Xanthomonas oryzae pv. oryzicola]
MQRVLIIGATSAIAEATARRYAARGAAVHLLGRQAARLHTIAADLTTRGARTSIGVLDVNDNARHGEVLD